MKHSPLCLSGLALAVLFIVPPPARADLIPWAYSSWSRSPADLLADAPGAGHIQLSDESLPTVVGDSNIVAANMRTFSTATPDHPDTFTAKAYVLTLTITDLASGQSGTMTFTGHLDGELGQTFSRITNTFTSAPPPPLVLGNNRYVASNLSFSSPGIPGSPGAGAISATVTVEQVPEPAAGVLSVLGSLALGGVRRRRRRK